MRLIPEVGDHLMLLFDGNSFAMQSVVETVSETVEPTRFRCRVEVHSPLAWSKPERKVVEVYIPKQVSWNTTSFYARDVAKTEHPEGR